MKKLLVILEENKDADFLCFRFAGNKKKYPQEKTKFPVKLRDYYPSSVEMALNLRKIGGRVRYDTRFGIGHDYCMGEESVLVNDLLAMECQGWFIPFTVTSHYGPSSGSHETMTPERLVAKGAVNAHIHPLSFPLRLLSQALRLRENRKLGIMKFLKYTLKGGFRYMRK